MSADDEYLRSLLSQPWMRGATGKGLVVTNGVLRTWQTDAAGNVHHSPALSLLGLAADDVVAYLAIETDGAVTLWPTGSGSDAVELVARAIAVDPRLQLDSAAGGSWHFG